MNKDKIINFENHIEHNLKKLGFDLSCVEKKSLCIGVAVSGGADSVSLFVAICHISKKYKIPVRAVTVNHNIRSESESSGDAEFVVALGKNLYGQGVDVKVVKKVLERGKVFSVAEMRGNGVEEAARFLRYGAFSEFYDDEKPAFIALAHNRNDQIETLLMRFLQGSGNSGLCGIGARRGIFVRPLLDVSREQIEEYLVEQNISWRTDSTNFDTSYMRNRIRQKLVPFLNENFFGFEKALLSGAQKAFDDEAALSSFLTEDFWAVKKNSVECDGGEFSALPEALKRRQIFAGINLLGGNFGGGNSVDAVDSADSVDVNSVGNAEGAEKSCGGRIPFLFVKEFLEAVDNAAVLGLSKNCVKKIAGNLLFCFDGKKIEIKKNGLLATESSFFVIIDKDMQFSAGAFDVFVELSENRKSAKISFSSEKDEVSLENVLVPFCVRSRQQDDFVRSADGGKKSLSDVLSDWHVSVEFKNSVPVVQELFTKNQEIIAVLGSPLGFKNWIVKPDLNGLDF